MHLMADSKWFFKKQNALRLLGEVKISNEEEGSSCEQHCPALSMSPL